tara:strand:+ start:726 stop:1133 length:408 start_codon:yes stop_codon:yes gene_type:complete
MSLDLDRVIYLSTATGSTGSLLNMVAILAESQRNNERDGLTGALAAHDERFIQVLEGPRQTLDGLLRRLGKDPRHKDITIIDRQLIDERLFTGWAMANARFSPDKARGLAKLVRVSGAPSAEILQLMRDAVGAAT